MNTINLVPTWEAAVRICCTVLMNEGAPYESKVAAQDELLRLARMVDHLNGEGDE